MVHILVQYRYIVLYTIQWYSVQYRYQPVLLHVFAKLFWLGLAYLRYIHNFKGTYWIWVKLRIIICSDCTFCHDIFQPLFREKTKKGKKKRSHPCLPRAHETTTKVVSYVHTTIQGGDNEKYIYIYMLHQTMRFQR